MLILIGIIVSVLIFSIIILVHEYGHFKSSRIFGVKVEEFGLGIPPRGKKLFSDKFGTEYTLNWLPLGGFVRLKGENVNSFNLYDKNKILLNNEDLEIAITNNLDIFDIDGKIVNTEDKNIILNKLYDNKAKDSLLTKPYWQQTIIILAGVFMNFVLASIIFSILFFIGVSPIGINDIIKTKTELKLFPSSKQAIEIGFMKKNPGVYLVPDTNSIALKAGIKKDDLVLKANNIEIDSYEKLKNVISSNKEKEINFDIKRALDNCDISKTENCKFENIFIKITPSKDGKIGSYLIPNIKIIDDFKYKYGFFESIKYGIIETYGQVILTFKGIGLLVQKIFNPETPEERKEAISQVSGPIGMVDFMTKTIGNGIVFVVIIGAIISINLGVFNLLPIPALDGGRVILIVINGLIEKIFGKKIISQNLEGLLHIGFFIFFIALSVIIAYNDVSKIINN